jgi:hypothetical protein
MWLWRYFGLLKNASTDSDNLISLRREPHFQGSSTRQETAINPLDLSPLARGRAFSIPVYRLRALPPERGPESELSASPRTTKRQKWHCPGGLSPLNLATSGCNLRLFVGHCLNLRISLWRSLASPATTIRQRRRPLHSSLDLASS